MHRYESLNVRERAIRSVLLQQPRWQDPLWQPQEQLQHDHPFLISMDEKYNVQPQSMLLSLIALVMRVQPLTPDKVAWPLGSHQVLACAHARGLL